MNKKDLYLKNSPLIPTLLLLLLYPMIFVMGCAANKTYELDLMPAPDLYTKGEIDPFSDIDPEEGYPYNGMLYATDRMPSENHPPYYDNKRGNVLRLGIAELETGMENMSWEEARQISLLKNRPRNFPIKVKSVEEFGVLDRSMSEFLDPDLMDADPEKPREAFIKLVNKKLSLSKNKDIYIYVHGYKVGFENPLLVATELWHFLGYDGVFIAYAWPSTPKTLAYGADLETAALSAHFLQILIETLAEQSNAENIHLVGYSAGTRVVIYSIYQLALLHHQDTVANIRKELRIGNVILTGSDFDRQLFGAYLHSGLLKVPKALTVYMSSTDQAMGISRLIFKQQRLGEMWKEDELKPQGISRLQDQDNLRLINVTEAEGAATGNGHAYFRKSPWVSSDILLTLMYGLSPEQRGLIQGSGNPVWQFPKNYNDKLKDVLKKANPELFGPG